MPARRKPISTRQKKADIQLKRAIKRGDVPPPDPKTKARKPKLRRGPTGNLIGSGTDPANATIVQAARRLQSAFITLSPQFLADTQHLASILPLRRPIPDEIAIFPDIYDDPSNQGAPKLSCPRRPKWRFDMTKKEVEHNEEGLFKKWLEEMDRLVLAWQSKEISKSDEEPQEQDSAGSTEVRAMPRSPTYFERNLEVWRQLWRVTEISQILLVLLDSRCPLLHFPPSLATYLADRKVILVLTKVDISGPERAAAWIKYFHQQYPHLRVVQVESYAPKEQEVGHQGRTQYEPHLPQSFRERLVAAIREVHAGMLIPPEKIKNNPNWLEKWKPSVKKDIDWEGVLNAGGSKVGLPVGGAALPRAHGANDEETAETEDHKEPEFLTVGLIGQPNVGKSSLLNALFGTSKVRASKTPGKTKHFQTLFWAPDVRLVDCPGLVMPNYVPMEMQVLSGILPISRVSAIPSCIHYASERIPIERAYKLAHLSSFTTPAADKRTWRDGMKPDSAREKKQIVWTAMDILTSYANLKKWVTAKAGRADIHRAGNAILRALAEGRVGWAFWPPGTDTKMISASEEPGAGLWIPRASVVDDDMEEVASDDDDEEEAKEDSDPPDSQEEMEEEESSDDDQDEGTSSDMRGVRKGVSPKHKSIPVDKLDDGTLLTSLRIRPLTDFFNLTFGEPSSVHGLEIRPVVNCCRLSDPAEIENICKIVRMFARSASILLLLVIPPIYAQTVYLAGDSTMARGGGGSGTDGWGQYLGQYLTIPVVNNAVAGRSSRSYTEEGRFATLANTAKSGDYVVIEFGHNDGTANPDNGRQVAFGDGYDTTATVTAANGTQIVIHTFPSYIQNAVNLFKAKGAIPIVSSQTPSNIWSSGAIAAPPRFVGYAQTAASRTSVTYVNHYAYVAQAYNKLGQTATTAFYPVDHTHTSPAGANVVAQAFVRGLLCGSSSLKSKVNSAGQAVPSKP
ncbi:putative ferrous iron transport protein B [Lyophyllum shimeji]|uniref:Guanine nucleotide-binding protein-like 1 n=1 Tax=Lyophyllum shimeji TaxID=47721 RepID=A0A9P3PI51_LYOSH|nr:putative ferrous iron transport protein B [Lyophyllum shimeji]